INLQKNSNLNKLLMCVTKLKRLSKGSFYH
ncbi:Excinuclease ABC subunit B, partial [uncultured Gammaproteobacteria bacterium]